MDLKANTAVDVLIGPFVDSTDGNTTEDGLTLVRSGIKLSKNGLGLTQKTDVTTAAFDDNGYYNCELDTTDTDTEGTLVLIVHEAGALPVRHQYNILSEAAWDSLYAAKDTGFMDVNVFAVGDTTQTANDNGADINAILLDTGELQTDWADGGRLDLIQDIIAVDTTTDIPALIGTAQTDLDTLTDDWNDGGRLDLILDSVLADTGELQTDWVDGGRLDLIQDIIAVDTTTDIPALIATAQTDLDTLTDDWNNGGRLDLILDIIAADTTTDIPALIAALNDIAATDIVSSGAITTLTGAIVNVDTVDTLTTYTGNTLQTADVNDVIDGNNRVDVGSWLGTAVTLGSGAPDINIASTDDIDLTTTQKASVNTEIDTALVTTTYGEPGQGAPAETASIKDKLSYMYKFARNKITNDGINVRVWDDAGSTIDQLSPVSSVGGTVTRGEFITGA